MIIKLYTEAFQALRNNKALFGLFSLHFLLSVIKLLPQASSIVLCFYQLTSWIVSLFLDLYLIGIVLKEKDLLPPVGSPFALARIYFWKSILVFGVSLFWALIILGLPYVLIDVVRDMVSGVLLWILGFVWCVVLNLLLFGLFNVGIMTLITKNSLAFESPALGLMDVLKNFRHYFTVYLGTVFVSYIPIVTSAALLLLRDGFGSFADYVPFSFFPDVSVLGLLSDTGSQLIFVLAFLILYLLQKTVLILSYLNRPYQAANNSLKTVTSG